ncbi:MAG: small multi-drug export protein [Patescibacteria group bacterium]|jgi:uncharacterized membrane protein|nr:small multi-drug export protein [Patescibacteria group bacterium]
MILDINQFVGVLGSVPSEVITIIIGATPIFELRGAIPFAVGVYEMSIFNAYFWSVLGNIIPVIIITFLLEVVVKFLSKKFYFWNLFFRWLFERTRRRAHDKIEKYGAWGLFFLVAIPLPITGGWTGALAAFLFGIEKKKSIPVIILGIMTAGVIVSLLTMGVVNL